MFSCHIKNSSETGESLKSTKIFLFFPMKDQRMARFFSDPDKFVASCDVSQVSCQKNRTRLFFSTRIVFAQLVA